MSLTLLVAVAAVQTTVPVDPTSAEARAVLAPVEATFAALAARDGTRLAPHFDAEARMTVVVERPDGGRVLRRLTAGEFADGLRPGPERFEEVMPDPIVARDGDVAMVWGRYLFRVDGRVSHCGANQFDLIRKDGVWTIAAITWNQRTTGCEG